MKSKSNQRRTIVFIFAFCCLGLAVVGAQGSGAACTVQISGGNFTGPTFVGNGNVTMMYVPKEDLLAVAKDLEQLEKEKQALIAKSKIADELIQEAEARIKIAEEKERAAELAKEASRKEKEKSIQALKEVEKANQNFDSNKQKFMSEVQIVVDEIEAGISRREVESLQEENSTPSAEVIKINEQIKEVEEKGKAIIRGLSCMTNDHEVYELKDENGSISFGFNVEDLKNDPNYTIVGELHEGKRLVKKFNVYGYMDKSGQPVINYQYDFADRFYNGKAIVQKNKDWFFIDLDGKVVKEFGAIERLNHLSGDTYEMVKGYAEHYLMDGQGNLLSAAFNEIQTFFGEDLFIARKNFGENGLIDGSGNFVLPCEYYYIGALDEYGFASIRRKITNEFGVYTKHGVINRKGKIIVEPKWSSMLKLDGKNGYTIYNAGDSKSGIIHHEKGMILPPKRRTITLIKNNTFLLQTIRTKYSKSFYGVFDIDRGMLLEENHEQIKFSTKGDFYWVKKGGTLNFWDLYNQDFAKLNGKKDDIRDYRDFNSQGIAYVEVKGKWGTINKQGKFLIKPIYEELVQVERKGIYRFKKEGEWGLLDAKGNTIHKASYDHIGEFDAHGFSLVRQSDKFGIMLEDGSFILPVKFESLQRLSKVSLIIAGPVEGEYQIFDFEGKEKGRIVLPDCSKKKIEIIDMVGNDKYFEIRACDLSNLMDKNSYELQVGAFYKEKQEVIPGYYLIKNVKDQWAVYNRKRQLVFGPFDEVIYLGDQYFKVRTKMWNSLGKKSDVGIIDLQGKVVVDYKYHQILEYRNQLAIVQKGTGRFDYGVVNLFGAEIIPPIFKAVKFTDLNQLEVTALNSVSNSRYIDETFIIDDKGNCLTNCEHYNTLLRKYYKK